MSNRSRSAQNAFRAALGPTPACPEIEELESFASGALSASGLSGHVNSCVYCQSELQLLSSFLAGKVETEGERQAAELLRSRSKEIFQHAFPAPVRQPWWKAAFTLPRLAQASLAAATIILVVGALLFFRSETSRPQLEAKNQTGHEVFRSVSFSLLAPAGDLNERPKEIRWEQVPGAATYQVRILEVDRTELWNAKATTDRIELPAGLRARIVPAKTLFCEVTAFDSSGKQLADTGTVRFRLVQSATAH